MNRFTLFAIGLLVLSSCKVRIPSHVISQSTMTDLLYDYHRAQQMAESMGGDAKEQRYVLVQKVFEKYGVSEAEFDSSMVWYSGNSIYLTRIYEDIDARLKREMKQLGVDEVVDEYANVSEQGDTARIWNRSNLWLKNDINSNLLTFNILPDSTFRLGDTFLLRFRNTFITQSNQREAYAMLVARYANDSVTAQVARVSTNFETTLRTKEDELSRTEELKQLSLTFYFSSMTEKKLSLWMVGAPSLYRFHHALPEEVAQQSSDSLQVDSAVTLPVDSLKPTRRDKDARLSPTELRQEHKGEKSIEVIKQRDVKLPAKVQRRSVKR